jgi:hypothetical protein
MIVQESVRNASRIVCIKSLNYEIIADIKTHTNNVHMHEFIHNAFLKKYDDSALHEILTQVLRNKACHHVWAIVLEQDHLPVFVIRNAAFTDRKLAFRRILRVKCDDVQIEKENPILGLFLLLNLIAFISILISNFCIAVSFLR